MYDIISIGDSTLDAFFDFDEKDAAVKCDLNKEDCVICFHYADKIPVKSFTRVPAAGNAANNAVGSARLGMKAAIYTNLGEDEIGRDILDVFKKEGVDTRYVVMDKEHGSNVSVVLNYLGERTILIYHNPRNYKLPADFGPTQWFYYTSMAPEHKMIHPQILELAKKSKMSFNPGTYQLKEGLEVLKPMMQASKIFVVNKDEAQRLVGDIADFKPLLAEVKKNCGGIVVITDGDNGSYAADGQKFYQIGIFPAKLVEKTGAGDAYATAFLAALFYGREVPEAMAWGAVNSASVVEQIGPQAGLLRKEQILTKIEGNPDFCGKEF